MITVNGKDFITLNEPIFVNDKRVIQVYANNILVYQDEYPASIKIINNPTKTQYTSGERIDLTGISVQAYKADGSVWQNSKYLNGIIPLSELICDPTVAHAKPSDFEYAGEEVKQGFGSILCTSEESEIVFVKYVSVYNNGTNEKRLAQRWKLKFKPTGGGCYSILYKKTGWWLTTCLTQCVKIGEFDETAYPLEISWECEFLISPGYTDGSERGTKQLGYLETRPYYYDLASGWYERSDFYDDNDSSLEYIHGTKGGAILIRMDQLPDKVPEGSFLHLFWHELGHFYAINADPYNLERFDDPDNPPKEKNVKHKQKGYWFWQEFIAEAIANHVSYKFRSAEPTYHPENIDWKVENWSGIVDILERLFVDQAPRL